MIATNCIEYIDNRVCWFYYIPEIGYNEFPGGRAPFIEPTKVIVKVTKCDSSGWGLVVYNYETRKKIEDFCYNVSYCSEGKRIFNNEVENLENYEDAMHNIKHREYLLKDKKYKSFIDNEYLIRRRLSLEFINDYLFDKEETCRKRFEIVAKQRYEHVMNLYKDFLKKFEVAKYYYNAFNNIVPLNVKEDYEKEAIKNELLIKKREDEIIKQQERTSKSKRDKELNKILAAEVEALKEEYRENEFFFDFILMK